MGDGSPGSREAEGEGGEGFYIAQYVSLTRDDRYQKALGRVFGSMFLKQFESYVREACAFVLEEFYLGL